MAKRVLASHIKKRQKFMIIKDNQKTAFEAHEHAHRCDTEVCNCPIETADYFKFCVWARNINTHEVAKLHFNLNEKVELI